MRALAVLVLLAGCGIPVEAIPPPPAPPPEVCPARPVTPPALPLVRTIPQLRTGYDAERAAGLAWVRRDACLRRNALP